MAVGLLEFMVTTGKLAPNGFGKLENCRIDWTWQVALRRMSHFPPQSDFVD
jgi:hypothetical protein